MRAADNTPRVYDKHPVMDSTRWDQYRHREGDIVVTTAYKAGTTWMQTIVANLIFQDGHFPEAVTIMSPWLDMDMVPVEDVIRGIEAQTHRRAFKTHLPFDGIPYFGTAKYIYVGRDGRDVFMSLWNHQSRYTPDHEARSRQIAAQHGKVWPDYGDDIHAFWADWITKSWFDWEQDGFPYWSLLHHVQSWWDVRHRDNILFVHFADLLGDTEAQVRRVAAFLDIEIDEALLPGILDRISFGTMKRDFDRIIPEAPEIWQGGGEAFMNKGTNGRWRGVLTPTELQQYEKAVAARLTPDCARWLESGGQA